VTDYNILLVAPISDSVEHPWFSPGRKSKLFLVGTLLQSIGNLTAINTSPDHTPDSFSSHQISKSNLILKRVIDIAIFNYGNLSKPDYIWVYNSRFYELLVVLALRLRFPLAPVVLQLEDFVAARKENSGIRGIFDLFSLRCLLFISSVVTCVSPAVENKVKKIIRSRNIPRIISFPPILNSDYLQVLAKRLPPFISPSVNILYAGGYSPEKGVITLLNAFVLLPSHFKLHLVGPISDSERHLCESLSPNITIHGYIDQSKLYNLYAKSDIVVNPHLPIRSVSSILPFKSIEQVASGALPLISSCMYNNVVPLPSECYFSSEAELHFSLLNSALTWHKYGHQIASLAEKIRRCYSAESVFASIRSAILMI
jgi:glycosyltransferase involved in cell wall biosynthesis